MPALLSALALIIVGLLAAGAVRAERQYAFDLTASSGPAAVDAQSNALVNAKKPKLKLLVKARTIKIITRTGKTVTLRGPDASAKLERITVQTPGLIPGR